MGPLLGVWAFSVVLLTTQKDLGAAVLLFAIFVVCLYICTDRVSWLIIGSGMFGVVAVGAFYVLPHVHTRVAVWLDPFAYPDSGYQMRESLFSLGTGGLFGTGLGAGRPDLVPLARTDFILSAIGEEAGLFGLVAVLLIYSLLTARGFRIAHTTTDSFGRLLAATIAFTIGFQVFIIAAGVTNLLPETGLTTPLMSYGGSSLVATFAAMALLLRVSARAVGRTLPTTSQTPRLPLGRRGRRLHRRGSG